MSDLTRPARAVLEAVRALRLGDAHGFENGTRAVFTIVMNDARCATDTRLRKLSDRVEAHGYRVTSATIHDATLRVDCVPSERNVGTVMRIARDGDMTILLLAGTLNPGLWTVPDGAVTDRRILLFTHIGDEVVLWRDLDNGLPRSTVSAMTNRTLPKI